MRADDEAVTDVIGTILMVGITIGMMVGLSIMVLSFDGPEDKVHADFRVDLLPGGLLWGDGNEEVTLRHIGGETVKTSDTRILIGINGTVNTYEGGALDQGFADGTFALGEYWNVTLTVPGNASVEVVVINEGANQIIGDSRLTADLAVAATGTSSIVYVDTGNAVAGTLSDLANAKDASDGGASAAIEEDSTPGGSPTVRLDGALNNAVGVTAASQALTSDNTRVVYNDIGDLVAVDSYDVPAAALTITNVKIGFEGNKGGGGGPNGDPQVRLSYSGVPLSVPTTKTVTLTSGTDNSFTHDITADKAAWSVSDVESIIAKVERLSTDAAARDAEIDHIFVEITYTAAPVTNAEVEFDFTGVPSGSIHELQVRYKTTTETFEMQVYDGSSWVPVCSMSSTSYTLCLHQLSLAEYQSGSPEIRFIDKDTGLSAGRLDIDYARVQTV